MTRGSQPPILHRAEADRQVHRTARVDSSVLSPAGVADRHVPAPAPGRPPDRAAIRADRHRGRLRRRQIRSRRTHRKHPRRRRGRRLPPGVLLSRHRPRGNGRRRNRRRNRDERQATHHAGLRPRHERRRRQHRRRHHGNRGSGVDTRRRGRHPRRRRGERGHRAHRGDRGDSRRGERGHARSSRRHRMSSPRRPDGVSERFDRGSDSTCRDDGRHGLQPALLFRRAVRSAVRTGLYRLERACPVRRLCRGQCARHEQLV